MLNMPVARVEYSLKGWSVKIDGKVLPLCYESIEEAQFVASLLLTPSEVEFNANKETNNSPSDS